jgi:hypothetical protein
MFIDAKEQNTSGDQVIGPESITNSILLISAARHEGSAGMA